jgi:CRP/FNR family transcriptional regulator, anaerobic regulatory protein
MLDLIRKNFPGIAEKDLQMEIMTVGHFLEFEEGEVILEIGTYVKAVPLVLSGSIKVLREDEDGRELFLYYLKPGESCTMSFTCCMMNKKSEIRTVAEEKTTIWAIPIQYMDAWMTKYQSWKNFVMQSYDTRMLELVKTIDSIAFKRMDERLMAYLHQKSKATESKILTGTHQQIAMDLNASREAISRLLKQLEKEGTVKLGRNKIELLT